MAEHRDLTGDSLHEPKGIAEANAGAADAGKVIVAMGDGTSMVRKLSLTDLEENLSVVYVSEESDFPAQVLGFIPLATRTTYIITQDVSVSFPFTYADGVLIDGLQAKQASLNYIGVTPMFANVEDDCVLNLNSIQLNCINAPLFGTVGSAGTSGRIYMSNVEVNAATWGTLNNISVFEVDRLESLFTTNGLTFTGVLTSPIINIGNALCLQSAGAWIDISAVTVAGGRVQFTQVLETGGPVVGINSTGAANIAAGSIFDVETCLLSVSTPLAGGVSPSSSRWQFFNALPIQDTQLAVTAYLTTPETVNINSVGVYEQILGGNWQNIQFAESVSVDADGIITVDVERPFAATIAATATVEKVGGGADVVSARLAINGVTLPESQGQTQNTQPTQVTCLALVQFPAGQTDLELRVANNTSTADVIVGLANITGTRVP